MEGIQLSVDKVGANSSISVIKVGGYIDTTTSSELEHALGSLLKAGSYNIIIDLGNVDYVSSAGWGIFISEIKGIREHGGDLKLVKMIPEVYEVFELLEFHYILKAFDTLEEAVKDFERSGLASAPEPQLVSVETDLRQSSGKEKTGAPSVQTKGASASPATIEEKVKKIVATNPEAGTGQIAKILNSPAFGNTKVGWFGLRRILKNLGLDSKSKRIEFSKKAR